MVQELASKIKNDPEYELMVENPLNMVCFRFHPESIRDEPTLNTMNESILHEINATGETFLTHTRIKGAYVIRLVAGQTYLEKEHLLDVWKLVRETCYKIYRDE